MNEPSTALEDVAPILHVSTRDRPDAKTQRYDRQLRLWASTGQTLLERASIVIGPATATAAQVLKNLVLPGVGSFTLFDSNDVNLSDLGNNFFLEESSLGKNRASEVSRLLSELNPDVRGNGVNVNLSDHLNDHPSQVDDTSLIHSASIMIGVGLEDEDELRLAERCWNDDIPLILVQTCGFLGSIRVQVKELGLVETHPDSFVDLRLDCPFPSLLEFVKSFDFESMDNHEHTHIPALVIIIHFLELFKSTHDGKPPKNATEREELKKMILAERRNADEDNFDEAVAMIRKACKSTVVPSSIQSLFMDTKCTTLSSASTPFWILVRTLREFVNRKQNDDPTSTPQLPLTGTLPDMKADTKNYVTLQALYRQKAQDDLSDFKEILTELLDQHRQIFPNVNPHQLSDETIQTFVKHSGFLKLIRGRSLAQERACPDGLGSLLKAETDPSTEQRPASWYLALRACGLFRQTYHRYPGSIPDESTSDQTKLEAIALRYYNSLGPENISSEPGLPQSINDALREITRAGGSELPQIAGLIGGIVAQESIKLISHQYIPLNGTCIFDGIKSYTSTLNL